MAYVIYNLDTTKLYSYRGKIYYKTEKAAKAAITRLSKKDFPRFDPEKWRIQDKDVYHLLIEETVERTNLITGEKYRERINTPSCCSPASESYWSM